MNVFDLDLVDHVLVLLRKPLQKLVVLLLIVRGHDCMHMIRSVHYAVRFVVRPAADIVALRNQDRVELVRSHLSEGGGFLYFIRFVIAHLLELRLYHVRIDTFACEAVTRVPDRLVVFDLPGWSRHSFLN